MEIYPGIEQDPDIRFGKPCIKGTRIDVATIIGDFAAGSSEEEICENYQLTTDQVQNALKYASHITSHVPPAKETAKKV